MLPIIGFLTLYSAIPMYYKKLNLKFNFLNKNYYIY